MRPPRPEWLIDTLREALPGRRARLHRRLRDRLSHARRLEFARSAAVLLSIELHHARAGHFLRPSGRPSALEGRPVVSVSGDGGFLMTAQELATAARYRLPVIALVHNDSTYGAIKNIQDRDHEGRYLDVELNNPDFLALAAAYQVPARRVSGPDELRTAIQEALDRGGPSLIEVPDRWRFLRDLAAPQKESSLTGSPSSRLPRALKT